jgi:cell wall-associated NlpC family hydrolase
MADVAIKYALNQVGKPYVWGASGPNAFDCSGLVYAAFKHAGYHFPAGRPTTGTLITMGHSIKKSQLKPGDLVFPDPGHVQIYIGNGQVVEAVEPGIALRTHAMWGFWRARRLVKPGQVAHPENQGKAQGIINAFSSLSTFANMLTSGELWIRLGAGAIGAILLGYVLYKVIG